MAAETYPAGLTSATPAELTITDALPFEQFKGDWLADPELAAQANASTLDNFLIPFANKFLSTVQSRMDANADIFKAINDDKGFADGLRASYAREVFGHSAKAN
ncbi:MAG: hypothetical protein CYG61_00005 [Actinobacteria bacterium]|nr:MAG: hypothetical protein CYG61_00005 [Actinomycetota bacterium]